jgi:hypothetical protein
MPVRVFKDIQFNRWAKREGLTDAALYDAASEIEQGLVDVRLGGFLLKKRVNDGRGKSRGFRTILAHRQGDRLVFLFGFAKKERDNIAAKEQEALRKLGDVYMAYSDAELSKMVRDRKIFEVTS